MNTTTNTVKKAVNKRKNFNSLTPDQLTTLRNRFKRANKEYRTNIAKSYGFSNLENFKKRLVLV